MYPTASIRTVYTPTVNVGALVSQRRVSSNYLLISPKELPKIRRPFGQTSVRILMGIGSTGETHSAWTLGASKP